MYLSENNTDDQVMNVMIKVVYLCLIILVSGRLMKLNKLHSDF